MFSSTDMRKMTLGELISRCYEELREVYVNPEALNIAVAERVSELLARQEAELV